MLFTDDCSFPKGRKIVIVGGVAGGGSAAARYFVIFAVYIQIEAS